MTTCLQRSYRQAERTTAVWARSFHFASRFLPVDKKRARLNCIHHLLSQFEYQEVERQDIQLPARERHADYTRQPVPEEMFVPEVY